MYTLALATTERCLTVEHEFEPFNSCFSIVQVLADFFSSLSTSSSILNEASVVGLLQLN
jgi:hypothetical protein